MSSVNEETPTHVVNLMGRALTVVKDQMEAEVAAAHKLRGSHLRLLSLTPVSGIRPTDLAVRVGMTKQSLGEFVAALEKAGYVEVAVDSRDRRARIVSPTLKGIKLQDRITAIIAANERKWTAEVGSRQWSTFIKVLRHIASS